MKRLLVIGFILLTLIGTASAANILVNSSQFNATAWTKYNTNTLMVNDTTDTTAPTGDYTADRIRFVSGSSTNYYIGQSAYVVSGQTYTFKFDVKPYNSAFYIVQLTGGSSGFGTGQHANFNVSSCTETYSTGGTATAVSNGSGWCTIGWSVPATGTGSVLSAVLFATNNNTLATRAPEYTAAASTYLYLWGGSMENTTGAVQTTSVFNTTNSSDGSVAAYNTAGASYTALRNSEGMAMWTTDASGKGTRVIANISGTTGYQNDRGVFGFDTSGIPDDATILGANFSVVATGASNQMSQLGTATYTITKYTPHTPGSITYQYDYSNITTQRFSDTNLTPTASARNIWEFSSTGLTYINKQGWTGIMMRQVPWDLYNDTTGLTWVDGSTRNKTQFDYYMSEAGGSNVPQLTIWYSSETSDATPVSGASFSPTNTTHKTVYGSANETFTATSTLTGTLSYVWSARNVTGNNVTWNFNTASATPTLTLPVGNYSIMVNITNGSAFSVTPDNTNFVNVTQWSQDGTDMLPLLPANHIYRQNITELPTDPRSAGWVTAVGTEFYGVYLKYYMNYPVMYIGSDADTGLFRFDRVFGDRISDTTIQYPILEDWDYETTSSDGKMAAIDRDNRRVYEWSYVWDTDHPYIYNLTTGVPTAGGGLGYDLQNLSIHWPLGKTGVIISAMQQVPLEITKADIASASQIDHALSFGLSDPGGSSTSTDYLWPAAYGATGYNTSMPWYGARFRLKADTDITTGWTANNTKVLQALKTYGGFFTIRGGTGGGPRLLAEENAITTTDQNNFITKTRYTNWIQDNLEIVDETSLMISSNSYAVDADVAPEANFHANVTSVVSGTSVPIHFYDDSWTIGGTYSWAYQEAGEPWFEFSTDQNPTYTFIPGTYSINQTITNTEGTDSEIKTSYITIGSAAAPTAHFNMSIVTATPTVTPTATPTTTTTLEAIPDYGAPTSLFVSDPLHGISGTYALGGSYYGGGTQYPAYTAGVDAVVAGGSTYDGNTVTSKEELLAALTGASSGDVIYIDPSAEIDMGNTTWLHIEENVTIASNRGVGTSAGGKIYTTTGVPDWNEPIFSVTHNNIRFTGLQLSGERYAVNTGGVQSYYRTGIYVTGATGFIIDNCDLGGFAYADVYLSGSPTVGRPWIHHNYINGSWNLNEGYGVNVGDNGDVLIEGNVFDRNRHSVTSDGDAGDKYTIRYNYFPDTEYQIVGMANIDAHGRPDGAELDSGLTYEVYSNTFAGGSSSGVHQRGRPIGSMSIFKNIFNNYPDASGWTSGNVPVYQSVPSGYAFSGMNISDNYVRGTWRSGYTGVLWNQTV